MSQFDTTFADGAGADLMDEFGETITYHPRNGESRDIQAIVTRGQRAGISESPRTLAPKARIKVYDNATTGISAAELDSGGDQVEFALRVGGDKQRLAIQVPDQQRAGFLMLEVR